jgi:hypothetical protein
VKKHIHITRLVSLYGGMGMRSCQKKKKIETCNDSFGKEIWERCLFDNKIGLELDWNKIAKRKLNWKRNLGLRCLFDNKNGVHRVLPDIQSLKNNNRN